MKNIHYTKYTTPFEYEKHEPMFSITLLDATLIIGFILVFVGVAINLT